MKDDEFPEDYSFLALPSYINHSTHELVYVKQFEVKDWTEIESEGVNWEIQNNNCYSASPMLGCISAGCLSFPGIRNDSSRHLYTALYRAYNKEGNVIFTNPDYANLGKPDSVEVNTADGVQPEYFDLFGNKVSEPQSGIYIRKTGDKVGKGSSEITALRP